jgi:threonylcarbamoyladenosine tRNA methylthiotransferase MtaB
MQGSRPDKCFYLYTLGCKVNWCDSEAMAAAAIQHGWQRVHDVHTAAVCIINTCTVTTHADARARKAIRRMRRESPDARIIVTGCYATTDTETLAAMPEVDQVLTCREEIRIGQVLDTVYDTAHGAGIPGGSNVVTPDIKTFLPSGERTRGFIKIQDGCNQFCAYCKVPYARGKQRSRPLSEIMAEAAAHVQAGCKELVLTGIHIAAYDDSGIRMPGLLQKLAENVSVPRIRISSLEATAFTDELMDTFDRYPVLMPHVHIPLQSGSDKVLKLMSRTVTRAEFLRAVRLFLAYSDLATVTTDVIVGLPGEDEDDFRQTLDIIDEIPFAKVHVFPFSPREGTAAVQMKDRFISSTVIHRREQELIKHAGRAAEECRAAFATAELDVLIERKHMGGWEGFSQNYLRVRSTRPDLTTNMVAVIKMAKPGNVFLPQ